MQERAELKMQKEGGMLRSGSSPSPALVLGERCGFTVC